MLVVIVVHQCVTVRKGKYYLRLSIQLKWKRIDRRAWTVRRRKAEQQPSRGKDLRRERFGSCAWTNVTESNIIHLFQSRGKILESRFSGPGRWKEKYVDLSRCNR